MLSREEIWKEVADNVNRISEALEKKLALTPAFPGPCLGDTRLVALAKVSVLVLSVVAPP